MSRVVRADWAATTEWDGINGRPSSFGATDIGDLTGHGYSNGQIAIFDSATGRFRPGSRSPAPDPTPPDPTPGTPTEISFTWDAPSLHALQTATEDFYFIGVLPSQPIAVGSSFDNQNVQISATVVADNIVRITVTNMGFDDLDLSDGFYRLRSFSDV